VDAAHRLFAARGFDAVTVDAVAEAAGVSRQTVFNYFPNKEDLVLYRADEVRHLIVSAVRDRPAGTPVIAAFVRFSDDFWRQLEKPSTGPLEPRVFHIVNASPKLRAYARELGARIVEDLAAVLRAETHAAPDDLRPHVVASAIAAAHAAVFDLVRDHVVAGERPDEFLDVALAAAQQVCDQLNRGLAGYPGSRAADRGDRRPRRGRA
jgi:AcrR family transcriptional regulator